MEFDRTQLHSQKLKRSAFVLDRVGRFISQSRNFIAKVRLAISRAILDERGSVESGLVLIPLVVIFLVTAQLVVAGNWINLQVTQHQSAANKEAIDGRSRTGVGNTSASNVDRISYLPLIGGGFIVVSERRQGLPIISNFASVIPGFSSGAILFTHRSTSLSEVFTD